MATTRKQWSSYNDARTKFDTKSNAVAQSVADRINAAGLPAPTTPTIPSPPSPSRPARWTCRFRSVPGHCTTATDDVLIEVFGKKAPNAADFVAAKRRVICAKAKKLGRLPDGSSDFKGLPYLISADKTWIVEPDEFAGARALGAKLGLPVHDMCAGIK